MTLYSSQELKAKYAAGQRDFSNATINFSDSSHGSFTGEDLSNISFHRSILFDYFDIHHGGIDGADLNGATLRNAKLWSAYLQSAYLRFADLRGADLREANLRHANLHGADLRDTLLNDADFAFANLRDAQLDGAHVGGTKLLGVELRPFLTGRCVVESPCHIDWTSVAKSADVPNLQEGLVSYGIPKHVADYMSRGATIFADDGEVILQSVFISYGRSDEPIARQIRDKLTEHGVITWFYPNDAIPGERHHRAISHNIERHDRVLVICSANSLTRAGVVDEIQRTLDRETEEGATSLLIPLAIDDFVFDVNWEPERPELKKDIMRRVVADFRRALLDGDEMNRQIEKLLFALRRPRVTAQSKKIV